LASIRQQPKTTVIEEFTNFVYTAGQGGTPVYSRTVMNVLEASVIEIAGQSLGNVLLEGAVVNVNLQSGTINGVPPTSNEIVLSLFTSATGTIVEESTGTITETVKVLIQGY